MKILVFSDVHGSYEGLKALIKTEDWANADKRIFLGDACIGCSRPNECIELLCEENCINLMGNNDYYICDHLPAEDEEGFSDGKRIQFAWMQQNIKEANKAKLKEWKRELYLNVDGKILYFTHYPWEFSKNDLTVIDGPNEKTLSSRQTMFEDIDADYIFFGHEHGRDNFTDGKKHFYCVDSVGLKFPGYYLMIEINNGQVDVVEKFVEFDINKEVDLMEEAGYPYNKNKMKRI